MIIVLGSATPEPRQFERALQISRAHVERSRAEPGCISHAVCIADGEPGSLLFVERWATLDDLHRHFAVAESRVFGRELSSLCAQPPSMTVHDASEVPIRP